MRFLFSFLILISSLSLTISAHANDELCLALFDKMRPASVSPELNQHVIGKIINELKNAQSSDPEILRLMVRSKTSLSRILIKNVEALAARHDVILPTELGRFPLAPPSYNLVAVASPLKLAAYLSDLQTMHSDLYAALGRHVELDLPSLDIIENVFFLRDFSRDSLKSLHQHLSAQKPSLVLIPDSNKTFFAMPASLFSAYVPLSTLPSLTLHPMNFDIDKQGQNLGSLSYVLNNVLNNNGVMTIAEAGAPLFALMPQAMLTKVQSTGRSLIATPLTPEVRQEVLKCANCTPTTQLATAEPVTYETPDQISIHRLTLLTLFRNFASVDMSLPHVLTERKPGAILIKRSVPEYLVLSAKVLASLDLPQIEALYLALVGAPMLEATRQSFAEFLANPQSIERISQGQLHRGPHVETLRKIDENKKAILFLDRHPSKGGAQELFFVMPYNRGVDLKPVLETQPLETPSATAQYEDKEVTATSVKSHELQAPERIRFTELQDKGILRNLASADPSTPHALTTDRPGAILLKGKKPAFLALSARVVSAMNLQQVEELYQTLVGAPMPSTSRESFEKYFADTMTFPRYAIIELYDRKGKHALAPIQEGGKAVLFNTLNPDTVRPEDAFFLLPYAMSDDSQPVQAIAPVVAPAPVAPQDPIAPSEPVSGSNVEVLIKPISTPPLTPSKEAVRQIRLGLVTEKGLFRQFASEDPQLPYALTANNPGLIIIKRQQPVFVVLSAPVVSGLDNERLAALYQTIAGVPMPPTTAESFKAFFTDNQAIERVPQSNLYTGNAQSVLHNIQTTSKPYLFVLPESKTETQKDLFFILPYNAGGFNEPANHPTPAEEPEPVATVLPDSLKADDISVVTLQSNEIAVARNTVLSGATPHAVVAMNGSTPERLMLHLNIASRMGLREIALLFKRAAPFPLSKIAGLFVQKYLVEKSLEAFNFDFKWLHASLLDSAGTPTAIDKLNHLNGQGILALDIREDDQEYVIEEKAAPVLVPPLTPNLIVRAPLKDLFTRGGFTELAQKKLGSTDRSALTLTRSDEDVLGVAIGVEAFLAMTEDGLDEIEGLYEDALSAQMAPFTIQQLADYLRDPQSFNRLPEGSLNKKYGETTLDLSMKTKRPLLFASGRLGNLKDVFLFLPYNDGRPPMNESEAAKSLGIRKSSEEEGVSVKNFAKLLDSWKTLMDELERRDSVSGQLFKDLENLQKLVQSQPRLFQVPEVKDLARRWIELLRTKPAGYITSEIAKAARYVIAATQLTLEYAPFVQRYDALVANVQYLLYQPEPLRVSFDAHALGSIFSDKFAAPLLPSLFRAIQNGIVNDTTKVGIQMVNPGATNLVKVVFPNKSTNYALYGCKKGDLVTFKRFTDVPFRADSGLADICTSSAAQK